MRKGLCAFCVSVLCAAVCGVAADSERGPSIREMELAAGAAPTDVSAEVERALGEAKARLNEGEPYAAKAVLMRLKRFTALRQSDYALIAPVEKQVDEALGKDREKIEAQIAAQIAQDAEAEQHWTEFRQLQMIQEEVNRKTSTALTEQARTLLYFENEPEKAKTLAFQAL